MINFAQNNSILNPQEYLATPEGLLLKAISQSNKPKQSGQVAIPSKLKNAVESKVAKNKSDKLAVKSGITNAPAVGKGIIRNIKEDLRSTIARYKDHIFSDDHIRDGIMVLGKDKETIMNSLYDTIMSIDKKGLLQEGPNQLRVMINGIDNIKIRCLYRMVKL